jgi:membrane protein implicated in regulation of membrane protease activity
MTFPPLSVVIYVLSLAVLLYQQPWAAVVLYLVYQTAQAWEKYSTQQRTQSQQQWSTEQQQRFQALEAEVKSLVQLENMRKLK